MIIALLIGIGGGLFTGWHYASDYKGKPGEKVLIVAALAAYIVFGCGLPLFFHLQPNPIMASGELLSAVLFQSISVFMGLAALGWIFTSPAKPVSQPVRVRVK